MRTRGLTRHGMASKPACNTSTSNSNGTVIITVIIILTVVIIVVDTNAISSANIGNTIDALSGVHQGGFSKAGFSNTNNNNT